MTAEKSVLIVDDSPADLQITMGAIKAHFKVAAATSGQKALDMAVKLDPDVILLDVNMPEMDGYEACQKLKALNLKAEVIFVSANTQTDEIMKGYEVGGSDYVVKPVMPDVLLQKLEVLVAQQNAKANLQSEVQMASQVAMTAMSSSGELSTVLEFLRTNFSVKKVADLSQSLNSCFDAYDLQVAYSVNLNGEVEKFANKGDVSPLESELLDRIAQMEDRISEHGRRLFLHHDSTSILVKNFPSEDDEKAGRLRDYLAIVAAGSHDKMAQLTEQKLASDQRNATIVSLISKAKESLSYIHEEQLNIEKENINILDTLAEGIDKSFLGLGLTEEQETQILSHLSVAQERSGHLFDKSAALENEMQKVLSEFNQLIED